MDQLNLQAVGACFVTIAIVGFVLTSRNIGVFRKLLSLIIGGAGIWYAYDRGYLYKHLPDEKPAATKTTNDQPQTSNPGAAVAPSASTSSAVEAPNASAPVTSASLSRGAVVIIQRAVKAYRPDNPNVPLGEFKRGSALSIGGAHPSGRVEVAFNQGSGPLIQALSDPSELTATVGTKPLVMFVPGSTYVCKQTVPAYNAEDGTKLIGEFKKDTVLKIGQLHSTGKLMVTYQPPAGGQAISALCLPSDFVIPDLSIEGWTTDLKLAQRVASEQGKLLLMDFTGSDWCGWCMKLDREVFRTAEFENYARENLVLLKVDFPEHIILSADVKAQNNALQSQYGVHGYPTVVVCNPAGNEVGRLGYMEGGPSAFIGRLKQLAGH